MNLFRLPPDVRIEALNRLRGSWRWYYVETDGRCKRVLSPLVLFALAVGWRPKHLIPIAVAVTMRKALKT